MRVLIGRMLAVLLLALLAISLPWISALEAGHAQSGARPASESNLQTIALYSHTLGRVSRVNILLPEGYATNRRRYPVLYLLHGFSNSYASWAADTDLVQFARPFPLIIVMPDGDDGWYIDDANGGPKWEDYHIHELIPYIDRHYRTIANRSGRAIAGLSMGGFGALSYAARHPDLFIAAASFSGALDVERLPALGFGIAQAFGLSNTWLRTANSPLELAANLAPLQLLYMATGTGKAGPLDGRDGQETGTVEAALYPGFVQTVAAFHAAGLRPIVHIFSPGTHSWPYWQRDLHQALPLIMVVLAHPHPPPATWSYTTGAASASIWGYTLAVARPPGVDGFVTIAGVRSGGFHLSGQGQVTVITAPRYRPGRTYQVVWDGRLLGTVHADRQGRLTLHLPADGRGGIDTVTIDWHG